MSGLCYKGSTKTKIRQQDQFNTMATFKICVFKHQKRKDGKYPVSIRICHGRKYTYLSTGFNVTIDQINKRNFELKDPVITKECNDRILKMERILAESVGFQASAFDAKALGQYLSDRLAMGDQIDFITYALRLADRRRDNGQETTARMYERTARALIDFCNGRQKILFSEISASFLTQFVNYLRTERTMTRTFRDGSPVKITRPGLADSSIAGYLTDVRTIFNAARNELNTETTAVITHYPFRAVKVTRSTPKRRNISADQVKKILAFNDYCVKNGRPKYVKATWCQAAAVFAISFYLCGMNTADIFALERPENCFVEYYRRKTTKRRQDAAFARIRVQNEVLATFDAYKDPKNEFAFNFCRHYADHLTFNANVNKALKRVAEILDVDPDLSTYFARHSWATIARNKAGVSRDDIDLALNHVDMTLKMADVYIEKDFSMVDRANRKVIDYLNSLPSPVINQSAFTPKSLTR